MTNKKNTKRLLIASVCLQFTLLIALTVQPVLTLTTGKTVTLLTVPVDPYNLFRGDYVRLSYDISNMPVAPPPKDNGDVYVALAPAGQYWKARIASPTRPVLLEGEVCIKGKAKKVYNGFNLHYGIEQVFVPEKTGRNAERGKALVVDLAIDNGGNAVIKKVMKDNETIYDTNNLLSITPK